MENSYKISAIVIVYHEQDVIARCLSNLQPYVDEIIVIHDGPCTDDTLDIAKKYTDKIYQEPRKGMMEFHLITGLQKAQYDWILRIDADEYPSHEMGHKLRHVIRNSQIDAVSFRWPIWDGNRYISQSWPQKTVLFRKSAVLYIEDPHSNYMVSGPILEAPYTLEHRPLYNNYDLSTTWAKQKRWALIHAQHIKKPLSQKRTYNIPKTYLQWPYILRHPRFGLRYKYRGLLPEILIGEACVFALLWLQAWLTHNTAKYYYYQVQTVYKLLFYLALRNIIRS